MYGSPPKIKIIEIIMLTLRHPIEKSIQSAKFQRVWKYMVTGGDLEGMVVAFSS